MAKINELREKRAKIWEQAKAFLDSHRNETGILSAEDTAAYEKMEKDIVDLGHEIERQQRADDLERELNLPTSTPLVSKPDNVNRESKTGTASEKYNKAFWNQMRNRSTQEVRNILSEGVDSEGGEVGVTAGSTVNVTADEIIDLYYSLKAPYRKNGVWLLNDSTVNIIRKLRTATVSIYGSTLLGKPVYTSSSIANAASGTKPIAFGDLSYYWIGDRQGVTFKQLNELYAANGQVGFLATKRVDARLIVPEAVKILKMKGTVSTGG